MRNIAVVTIIMCLAVLPCMAATYEHKIENIADISFQTPSGVTATVDWSSGSFLPTNVDLSSGESFFVWTGDIYDWEAKENPTDDDLGTMLGSDADKKQYTVTSTKRVSAGNYIVTGRLMRMDEMLTRSIRTFDLDGNGIMDFKVTWNGKGKISYDLINFLAENSHATKLEPNFN